MTTLSTEFSALADRAAVEFPEDMRIQGAACGLLGSWALKHRADIASALRAVEWQASPADMVQAVADLRDCAYVERRTAGTDVTIETLERAADLLERLTASMKETDSEG
jgi:hypothetical protein